MSESENEFTDVDELVKKIVREDRLDVGGPLEPAEPLAFQIRKQLVDWLVLEKLQLPSLFPLSNLEELAIHEPNSALMQAKLILEKMLEYTARHYIKRGSDEVKEYLLNAKWKDNTSETMIQKVRAYYERRILSTMALRKFIFFYSIYSLLEKGKTIPPSHAVWAIEQANVLRDQFVRFLMYGAACKRAESDAELRNSSKEFYENWRDELKLTIDLVEQKINEF